MYMYEVTPYNIIYVGQQRTIWYKTLEQREKKPDKHDHSCSSISIDSKLNKQQTYNRIKQHSVSLNTSHFEHTLKLNKMLDIFLEEQKQQLKKAINLFFLWQTVKEKRSDWHGISKEKRICFFFLWGNTICHIFIMVVRRLLHYCR